MITDPASRSIRILLLEDDAADAALLCARLARARPGWNVDWVRSGVEFERALHGSAYDVIVADTRLPTYSAEEALEHVRARVPSTPLIVVSGRMGEEYAVEVLKLGAVDYLLKSRLDRLPFAVERAIRESDGHRSIRAAMQAADRAESMHARFVALVKDHAVVLLDGRGAVTAWNPAAESMFGHAAAEVIGRPIDEVLRVVDDPGGSLASDLDTARAAGQAESERWIHARNGSRLRVEDVTVPLGAEDGTPLGFAKVLRDTTRAFEATVALQQAKAEAERANAAKDRFLAMLSHELRTPLAPIVAATHVLERRATVPPDVAHLLPMIRRNIALEARLIEDLLDLTLIGQGKLRLKRETIALHPVVQAVLDLLDQDVRAKPLVLETSFADPGPWVDADEARLQQVLLNVLRNAVKFTPAGGRIALRTVVDGATVRIECRDSGVGIRPAALPRLFVAFDRADDEVARRYGGMGLGLNIARTLAELHGGTIEAHSDGEGRGSTFTIVLPAVAPDVASGDTRPLSLLGRRVLLVGHDAEAGAALAAALRGAGAVVTVAADVDDAGRAIASERIDALVARRELAVGEGAALIRRHAERLAIVSTAADGITAPSGRRARRTASPVVVAEHPPSLLLNALLRYFGDD
jgi:PAS domain S-box-containing protein